jgi:hypothetical protein
VSGDAHLVGRVVCTVAEVEQVLATIDLVKWDDEVAHSYEDDLHRAVLRAIATGRATDPVAVAEAALRTVGVDFARWCA